MKTFTIQLMSPKAFIFFLTFFVHAFMRGQPSQKIKSIETINKAYGYVRYFHPADEATTIDWDKFVVYGYQEVEKRKNQRELLFKLKELFLPIRYRIHFGGLIGNLILANQDIE